MTLAERARAAYNDAKKEELNRAALELRSALLATDLLDIPARFTGHPPRRAEVTYYAMPDKSVVALVDGVVFGLVRGGLRAYLLPGDWELARSLRDLGELLLSKQPAQLPFLAVRFYPDMGEVAVALPEPEADAVATPPQPAEEPAPVPAPAPRKKGRRDPA